MQRDGVYRGLGRTVQGDEGIAVGCRMVGVLLCDEGGGGMLRGCFCAMQTGDGGYAVHPMMPYDCIP